MTTAAALTPIPLLDTRAQLAPIRAEIDAAVAAVLNHGQFVLGPEVARLETEIAGYCGVDHAIACASGSDALLLPLMALGVQPGDSVITTPYTFFATASAIHRLGATPVFVDIDPATFNLHPDALRAKLRTLDANARAKVKAVIPVHLYGQCADMKPILAIAAEFGIPVIEDAAQAIGARYQGKRACALGWCGTLSFYPSKNLSGMGDGGMITTNDPELARKLRMLRVHGSEARYYHQTVGINSRLDTLQAAILLVKLAHLDQWNEGRRRNAEIYRGLLSGAPVTLPVEHPDCYHVYNQFVIRSSQRDALMNRFRQAGAGCEIYYPVPLHLQECFAYCGHRPGDFPESERAARETLAIPIQPELSPESIQRIAGLLQS